VLERALLSPPGIYCQNSLRNFYFSIVYYSIIHMYLYCEIVSNLATSEPLNLGFCNNFLSFLRHFLHLLFFFRTRYFRLILYLLCPSPRTGHFSKGVFRAILLLVEILALWPFQRPYLKIYIYTHTCKHKCMCGLTCLAIAIRRVKEIKGVERHQAIPISDYMIL
jgi:hypothetical protein